MARRKPPLTIACAKCESRTMRRNGYAKNREGKPTYPQANCRTCGHTQLITEADRDTGEPPPLKPKMSAKEYRDMETKEQRAKRLQKDRDRKRQRYHEGLD